MESFKSRVQDMPLYDILQVSNKDEAIQMGQVVEAALHLLREHGLDMDGVDWIAADWTRIEAVWK